jgi:hypothetical protein
MGSSTAAGAPLAALTRLAFAWILPLICRFLLCDLLGCDYLTNAIKVSKIPHDSIHRRIRIRDYFSIKSKGLFLYFNPTTLLNDL